MHEYEVSVKFHIFPFKKILITAKNEKEAKEIANVEAQQIKESLRHSIYKVKAKSYIIDEFL